MRKRFVFLFLVLLALVVAASFSGYRNATVYADQVGDIGGCGSAFDTHISTCDTAFSDDAWICAMFYGPSGPSYEQCLEKKSIDHTDCYSNSITGSPLHDRSGYTNNPAYTGDGLNGCLQDNVFFTMDMCTRAQDAADACDRAFSSCQVAGESIENQNDAYQLVSGCVDTYYSCLSKSGIYQCF